MQMMDCFPLIGTGFVSGALLVRHGWKVGAGAFVLMTVPVMLTASPGLLRTNPLLSDLEKFEKPGIHSIILGGGKVRTAFVWDGAVNDSLFAVGIGTTGTATDALDQAREVIVSLREGR